MKLLLYGRIAVIAASFTAMMTPVEALPVTIVESTPQPDCVSHLSPLQSTQMAQLDGAHDLAQTEACAALPLRTKQGQVSYNRVNEYAIKFKQVIDYVGRFSGSASKYH